MEKLKRIDFNDSLEDVVVKLSEGNPGAITCLMEIMKFSEKRMQSALIDRVIVFLMLDSLNIYGTDIYVLWSDICKTDTSKMIAILIGIRQEFISANVVKIASGRQDYSGVTMIPVEAIYKQVISKYPGYDIEYENEDIIREKTTPDPKLT